MVLVLLLFSGVLCIPDDWQYRVAAGQMLFSASPPADGLFPNIGNGFVGTTVGCSGPNWPQQQPGRQCGIVYVAGVFNGLSYITPSHRAALPSPHSSVVSLRPASAAGCSAIPQNARVNCGYDGVTEGQCYARGCCFDSTSTTACFVAPRDATRGTITLVGAALDLERGVFYNRTVIANASDCAYAEVEQSFFAHRDHRHLLVYHISVRNMTGASCRVYLASCGITNATDFNYTDLSSGSPSVALANATTLQSETNTSSTTTVGIAWNPVPGSVLFTTAQRSFTFLAVYRTSLEEGTVGHEPEAAQSDLAAYERDGYDHLLSSHVAAWAEMWEGGIEIEGNLTLAASVNSSLYYILSSMRADWPHGCSPGGIAVDAYNGHSFWDCETWMYPNLLLLNPSMAEAMLWYRLVRMAPAAARAQAHGLEGLMWPWESAVTGVDCVPLRYPEGTYEIHISADIPLAFRLFYRMSGNITFLRESWPLIFGSAEYFASRAVPVPGTGNFTLLSVIPPDESAGIINSSVYTNAVAGQALLFAVAAGEALGEAVPYSWTALAEAMYLPVSDALYTGGDVHPEYAGYAGQDINQADVALLQYPLGMTMPEALALNDLVYYQAKSSTPETAGYYTGDSAYSIAWIRIGNLSQAESQFALAFKHMDLSHFNVWTETDFGNLGHHNFITGAGGYLQNILNGYAGAELLDDRLVLAPTLPPMGATAVTIRGLSYRGARFTYHYNDSMLELRPHKGPPLAVSVPSTGKTYTLAVGLAPVVLTRTPVWLTA